MNKQNKTTHISGLNAERYLKELRAANLAVWRESEQRWQPIPAALSPVTVAKKDWDALTMQAQAILSAFPVLHTWLQKKSQAKLFQLLYNDLNPLDKLGAELPTEANWGHATIRFDLFWHHGQWKVIEANCTIPAMQAYSDLILSAWHAAGGQSTKQTSNTQHLIESLLQLHRRDGGSDLKNIAILHRPGDSQMTELRHYEKTWANFLPKDVNISRIHPDDVDARNGKLFDKLSGQSIDLMYRHCFAWRLEHHQTLKAALHAHRTWHIYNPISAHYEVKAFLALLSHICLHEKTALDIGLSKEQIRAVNERVPITRIMSQDLPAYLLHGETQLNAKEFEKNIERYVIKKSFGYGGHQVFMGSEWTSDVTQAKLRLVMKSEATHSVSPTTFLEWLKEHTSELWIIQDRMAGKRHRTKVIQSDDSLIEIDGYVDASIFLNTGTAPICHGGVSRIAAGPVVNIGTGGGLAPFLVE